MELWVILAMLGAALGLGLYTVLSQVEERDTVRRSLRQLDDYEVENVRDQELLAPLAHRAFMPVLGGLTNVGRRFTPVGYVDNIRQKFIYAGRGAANEVDRFLAVRVVTIAMTPVAFWFTFIWNPVAFEGNLQLVVFALLILALVLGPDASINRQVEARQYELRRELPDVLDLLTISVEAGLGFEQALDRTISAVPGALSAEFSRMLGEVRAGASRADAMRALEQRTNVPEIRSFVLAIIQADTFGVSIGRVLRAQADEMRIKRRQIAQEEAQKAPVKMLIPMVFCIFPALFVVVIGPAIINIRDAF
jgi:tight adherence protein C